MTANIAENRVSNMNNNSLVNTETNFKQKLDDVQRSSARLIPENSKQQDKKSTEYDKNYIANHCKVRIISQSS